MIKKLKALHPYWVFVSSKTMTHIDSSVKLVFIDTKQMGHSLEDGVRARCSPGTKVVFINRRNINYFEQEMLTRI